MSTSGPGQSPLLLAKSVAVLEKASVPYAVIGAMAMAFHGVVRASLDADLLLFPGSRSLEDLGADMRKAGLSVEVRAGDADDPIPSLIRLEDAHGNRVDMLSGLRGMESEALSRTVTCDFEGTVLRIIGAEDLIAMKLFAGSPRDIDDARRTISAAAGKLDLPLLQRLALHFGRKEAKLLATLIPGQS